VIQLRALVQTQLEDARYGMQLLERSKETVTTVRGQYVVLAFIIIF